MNSGSDDHAMTLDADSDQAPGRALRSTHPLNAAARARTLRSPYRRGALALSAAIAAALVGARVSAADSVAKDTGGDDEARPVSFELGSSLQYDSNVAVLDLDTSANAGDRATLLEFGLGYDRPRNGAVGVQAGYNFSQTLHDEFDEFNVGIHRGSANLSIDLDKVDMGAMLQYAHASLDGDEFLVLTQISPYALKLLGKRLFVRFAYTYSEKDFAANPGRDANADSVSADTFVFLNGLETYLVFGVRYDDEDAIDGQFDYAGHKLRAQLSRRIPLGARQLTLKAHVRYEMRDYDRPTLSIGEPRNDDRYQFEATAEVPLSSRISTTFSYKYADNRSNLQSVDFDENVITVGFRAGL